MSVHIKTAQNKKDCRVNKQIGNLIFSQVQLLEKGEREGGEIALELSTICEAGPAHHGAEGAGQKIVTAQTQPQHNLNLTQWVGMDMKMALHTHPTHHETQLPSQGASDQPLMLPKEQHQH